MQLSSKPNYPPKRTKGLTRQEPKITDKQADDIRKSYIRHHREFGLKPLAEKYGVSAVAIRKVVREETHVPDDWGNRPRNKEPRNKSWNSFDAGGFPEYSSENLWEICQQLMKEVEEELGLRPR